MGPFLYTGITLAIFILSGTTPDENEQLKRYASGRDKRNLRIFNNFVGMLKGPVDLEGLSLLISSSISVAVVGKSTKLWQSEGLKKISNYIWTVAIDLARSVPIVEK